MLLESCVHGTWAPVPAFHVLAWFYSREPLEGKGLHYIL